MRVADRLRRMIEGTSEGGSVVLKVDSVHRWLDEEPAAPNHDLTVAELAEHFGRSPITVRAWIRSGELRAYRFRGREYRITHTALGEFQQRER